MEILVPRKKSLETIQKDKVRINTWHKNNPERVKEIKRAYYLKNKEQIVELNRERRKKNAERYREYSRTYYARNAEKIRLIEKQRRLENPEIGRRYAKKYRQTHKEIINEKRKSKMAEYRAKINEIKLKSGCVDCGYNLHPFALDFDHVDGEKYKQVSAIINFEKALEEIKKCEVRCANCHRVKTWERWQVKGWRNRKKVNHNG